MSGGCVRGHRADVFHRHWRERLAAKQSRVLSSTAWICWLAVHKRCIPSAVHVWFGRHRGCVPISSRCVGRHRRVCFVSIELDVLAVIGGCVPSLVDVSRVFFAII
jgi:hypothetical protein